MLYKITTERSNIHYILILLATIWYYSQLYYIRNVDIAIIVTEIFYKWIKSTITLIFKVIYIYSMMLFSSNTEVHIYKCEKGCKLCCLYSFVCRTHLAIAIALNFSLALSNTYIYANFEYYKITEAINYWCFIFIPCRFYVLFQMLVED